MVRPYIPSESVVEAYTDGDCWHLAGWLRRLENFPTVFVCGGEGAPFEDWHHAGALLPSGRILDIEGAWPERDWGQRWGDSFGYNIDVLYSWDEFHEYTEDQFRYYNTNTRRVATRLLETYVWG